MNTRLRACVYIQELVNLGAALLGDDTLLQQIARAGRELRRAVRNGNKILICGNGGSAAEAQHFAAELVGRFQKKRRAIPAMALTTDTSILTALANDDGFETVFSRQVEAHCHRGDLVIGLTTSDVQDGHSKNLANAFWEARRRRARTIGLVSAKTIALIPEIDIPIVVPQTDTALTQVAHLHIIHFLCTCAEEDL